MRHGIITPLSWQHSRLIEETDGKWTSTLFPEETTVEWKCQIGLYTRKYIQNHTHMRIQPEASLSCSEPLCAWANMQNGLFVPALQSDQCSRELPYLIACTNFTSRELTAWTEGSNNKQERIMGNMDEIGWKGREIPKESWLLIVIKQSRLRCGLRAITELKAALIKRRFGAASIIPPPTGCGQV